MTTIILKGEETPNTNNEINEELDRLSAHPRFIQQKEALPISPLFKILVSEYQGKMKLRLQTNINGELERYQLKITEEFAELDPICRRILDLAQGKIITPICSQLFRAPSPTAVSSHFSTGNNFKKVPTNPVAFSSINTSTPLPLSNSYQAHELFGASSSSPSPTPEESTQDNNLEDAVSGRSTPVATFTFIPQSSPSDSLAASPSTHASPNNDFGNDSSPSRSPAPEASTQDNNLKDAESTLSIPFVPLTLPPGSLAASTSNSPRNNGPYHEPFLPSHPPSPTGSTVEQSTDNDGVLVIPPTLQDQLNPEDLYGDSPSSVNGFRTSPLSSRSHSPSTLSNFFHSPRVLPKTPFSLPSSTETGVSQTPPSTSSFRLFHSPTPQATKKPVLYQKVKLKKKELSPQEKALRQAVEDFMRAKYETIHGSNGSTAYLNNEITLKLKQLKTLQNKTVPLLKDQAHIIYRRDRNTNNDQEIFEDVDYTKIPQIQTALAEKLELYQIEIADEQTRSSFLSDWELFNKNKDQLDKLDNDIFELGMNQEDTTQLHTQKNETIRELTAIEQRLENLINNAKLNQAYEDIIQKKRDAINELENILEKAEEFTNRLTTLKNLTFTPSKKKRENLSSPTT